MGKISPGGSLKGGITLQAVLCWDLGETFCLYCKLIEKRVALGGPFSSRFTREGSTILGVLRASKIRKSVQQVMLEPLCSIKS